MAVIQNRYEFLYYVSCTNANPNGDPDMGNTPRLDVHCGHWSVSAAGQAGRRCRSGRRCPRRVGGPPAHAVCDARALTVPKRGTPRYTVGSGCPDKQQARRATFTAAGSR